MAIEGANRTGWSSQLLTASEAYMQACLTDGRGPSNRRIRAHSSATEATESDAKKASNEGSSDVRCKSEPPVEIARKVIVLEPLMPLCVHVLEEGLSLIDGGASLALELVIALIISRASSACHRP